MKTYVNKTLIAALTATTVLSGCQTGDLEANKTLIGAVAGAAVGAAAGTLVGGDDRRNALVGAGIGLLVGAGVGNYLDRQAKALEEDLEGTGATVDVVDNPETGQPSLLVTMPGNVTFATNSTQITSEFYGVLDRMSGTLNQYPQSYINVIGHTDSQGSNEYNQRLSEGRANSVANYITGRGVLPARVVAIGRGETQPIASNADEYGRAQNRRVELEIIPATQDGLS